MTELMKARKDLITTQRRCGWLQAHLKAANDRAAHLELLLLGARNEIKFLKCMSVRSAEEKKSLKNVIETNTKMMDQMITECLEVTGELKEVARDKRKIESRLENVRKRSRLCLQHTTTKTEIIDLTTSEFDSLDAANFAPMGQLPPVQGNISAFPSVLSAPQQSSAGQVRDQASDVYQQINAAQQSSARQIGGQVGGVYQQSNVAQQNVASSSDESCRYLYKATVDNFKISLQQRGFIKVE